MIIVKPKSRSCSSSAQILLGSPLCEEWKPQTSPGPCVVQPQPTCPQSFLVLSPQLSPLPQRLLALLPSCAWTPIPRCPHSSPSSCSALCPCAHPSQRLPWLPYLEGLHSNPFYFFPRAYHFLDPLYFIVCVIFLLNITFMLGNLYYIMFVYWFLPLEFWAPRGPRLCLVHHSISSA